MSDIFTKQYGSLMIQNGFKYREEINCMCLLMQTSGIVQRTHSHYKKKQYEFTVFIQNNFNILMYTM